MKNIILLIFFSSYLFSSNLKVDDKIDSFSLINQFDKIESVTANISTILVAFDNKSIDLVIKYLSDKSEDFLKSHQTIFVTNITNRPIFELRMITLPKLKRCKYSVLVLNDDKDSRFSKQDEKITVYKVKNGFISDISYLDSLEKLNEFF